MELINEEMGLSFNLILLVEKGFCEETKRRVVLSKVKGKQTPKNHYIAK